MIWNNEELCRQYIQSCNIQGLFSTPVFVNARDTTISVQALRECHCLGLSMARCREQLLRDYTFLTFVARRLGERLGDISNHQSLNTSYSVEVRLARYIHYTRCGDMFEERLTEAAEYLGVSYRHLQRIIAKFCADLSLIHI